MFNFNIDKKYLYIGLALLVIISISNMSNPKAILLSYLFTVPGIIIAISFHEFAHAYAAVKLGDNTPREQNRLTLNPLNHLDPVGIILLLTVHIGWGKPVQINPVNFNRNISMSAGEAIVSVAGPLMNFVLAILFSIIYALIYKFAAVSFVYSNIGIAIIGIVYYTIIINIGLGVFNLIPLPPLDGSKILNHFLSSKAKYWINQNQNIFYFIFLILWITGALGNIISPLISGISNGLMNGIFKII